MNEKQVKENALNAARLEQLRNYTEQELTDELDRRRLTWALVMRPSNFLSSMATSAAVARNHGYHYFVSEEKVYALKGDGGWIATKFTAADVK